MSQTFPTSMDGTGTAARSGRREVELRALQNGEIHDGLAGDAPEQQAAHGLAGSSQVLVDGLDRVSVRVDF